MKLQLQYPLLSMLTVLFFDFWHLAHARDCKSDPQFIEMQNYIKTIEQGYKNKISYLENEIQKSKHNFIELSLSKDKINDKCLQKLEEKNIYCRNGMASKDRTIMEYQRQLEKHPPKDELKRIIYSSTMAVIEKRKFHDHFAVKALNQQYPQTIKNESDFNFRVPASLPHGK